MPHTTESCDKREVEAGTIRVETRLWVALIRYRHCTQPQEKNRHYYQFHHHYYYITIIIITVIIAIVVGILPWPQRL